jgi:SAM-dependent methyltransferase
MSYNKRISGYYAVDGLGERILSALEAAGKDPDALAADDLAPIDAFHIRGRKATAELASWADLRPDERVLDIGCGLGGTCRFLAEAYRCRVTGVDITGVFCRVAALLSARTGLADRTDYHQCDAAVLPFSGAAFDVVWTEHVQMNVPDKRAFYREIHRVLKPGGRLVFHELFSGEREDLLYPLPWAGNAAINHVVPADTAEALLSELGFGPRRWEDKTAPSEAFFARALARIREKGWPPAGIHLLMGPDTTAKFENLLKNLESGRLRVVQAVVERR